MPKVFVIIHSFWGHVKTLADSVIEGLKAEGVDVTLYRVPETLPKEVLGKMYAQTYDDIPEITPDLLKEADGFLFGFGTRYGSAPAQVKAFWDHTGGLWASQALAGKYGGVFTSTSTQHGGQEHTISSFITHYVHHGILFVPLGYGCDKISGTDEVFGGGPWGAGTLSNADGSRQVSQREKDIAFYQGEHFAKTIKKAVK
ncbi:NAD(P)H:quinone oxidoreductase, type IV [Chytriomyces sp. MP71]|nr:NAD(P)H:quinone oxidoreductase, type IV [Chytriomyces sp. MP71]